MGLVHQWIGVILLGASPASPALVEKYRTGILEVINGRRFRDADHKVAFIGP